jgi:hypothetical protein
MSVIAGIGKLRNSAKQLRQQWSEVQSSWHDENARLFYENQIEPLLARVRAVELAMSQIAATAQKARHDCE